MLFPSLEVFQCCLKQYFSQTHRIKKTNLWLPKGKGGDEGQLILRKEVQVVLVKNSLKEGGEGKSEVTCIYGPWLLILSRILL